MIGIRDGPNRPDAGATNIILRAAIGIGQSISAEFNPLGGARPLPHPMVFFGKFSRLRPRLSAAKISHNSDFLMKILITKGQFELGSSIARRGSARAIHRVTETGGRKYE